MSESGPIRVVLADDHAVVRGGVRAMLETHADITVVGEAADGEEVVLLATEHRPDVLLLDLVMPSTNAAETVRRIKAASPTTEIVVLSSFDGDGDVFPVLRSGALSYLLKDVSPDKLVEAIRSAARSQAVLHPRVAARLVRNLRGEHLGEVEPLSERELEVLRAVAAGRNNKEIAQELTISEKTVKSHVSSILGKLQLRDRTQVAVYAWRQGLIKR